MRETFPEFLANALYRYIALLRQQHVVRRREEKDVALIVLHAPRDGIKLHDAFQLVVQEFQARDTLAVRRVDLADFPFKAK